MKRKWVPVLAGVLACSFLLAGCQGTDKDNGEDEANEPKPEAVMEVADAKLSEGGLDGYTEMPEYDKDNDAVTNLLPGAGVEYTVPAGVDGTYDIYLEIGKASVLSSETMFDVIVNDADHYVLPTDVESMDGKEENRFDMGNFLVAENVDLKAGDRIKVTGKEGFSYSQGDGKFFCFEPAVGDLSLYEAGAAVPVGYDGGKVPEQQQTDATDPLSGKTICWLGSSVTFGDGYSMAEVIAENHANTRCLKYAISGTTLANSDNTSYVARMKSDISPDLDMDLMVVQLSTNDATKAGGPELGAVSESRHIEDFDDTTVIGAMETIIAYTQETWGCPVVFYTGTRFDNEKYGQMVDALQQLQEKWGIGIVDLWNNQAMTDIIGTEQYDAYMKDKIHPNATGYREWWTPEFEKVLAEYLTD